MLLFDSNFYVALNHFEEVNQYQWLAFLEMLQKNRKIKLVHIVIRFC